jgi:hypothetical protein
MYKKQAIAISLIACLALTTVTADPFVSVGTGGSTSTAECGAMVANAEGKTSGLLPSAGADAGGDGTGKGFRHGSSSSKHAIENDKWVSDDAALTWAEGEAQNALEAFPHESHCDLRELLGGLDGRMSNAMVLQFGCIAQGTQIPMSLAGTLGVDSLGAFYFVSESAGASYVQPMNGVIMTPTLPTAIAPELEMLGGAITVTFTEHSCSVLAS